MRLPASRVALSVAVLTLVGAGLRFATLDRQSFWLDELVTVSLLRRGFWDLLETIPSSEATPYLYYVLAWPWARVAGFGEVGLRSLSALAGAALVPVAYGIGAALVSRRAGVVAAALVAVNPFLVWYAQEARSYSLFALLAGLSLLFFARALRDGRGSSLAGWAIASSLALATHYFALFVVLPEALWLLARARPRRPAALATLVPAGVLLLHLPLLLRQRETGEAVTEARLASRILGIPKDLLVGFSFPWEIAGTAVAGALAAAGLALLAARAGPLERRGALLAGALAAVVVGVPVLAALAGADFLVVRNVVAAIVPGAVLLAGGYASSRLGLAAAGALCALWLAIWAAVALDTQYGRTDWRGAAERLDAARVERAIVVTPFMSRSLWSPYLPRLAEPEGDESRVSEIAVVALATEGGYSAGPLEPPSVPPREPPRGFELASVEREPTFVLVRYRAPRPTRVENAELAGLALSATQPGILLQSPAAP